jgi:hypothetical protein
LTGWHAKGRGVTLAAALSSGALLVGSASINKSQGASIAIVG